MQLKTLVLSSALAVGAAIAASSPSGAQGMQGPMMPRGNEQHQAHGMSSGEMAGGMMCPMMQGGMMGHRMMGRRAMNGGMMGGAMMRSGARQSGMGALFGSRVRPVMNLSADDVRGYLDARLQRLGNKRLKLGAVSSTDETITAEIVTVDNSLVQRLKVDRHTGAITYEN